MIPTGTDGPIRQNIRTSGFPLSCIYILLNGTPSMCYSMSPVINNQVHAGDSTFKDIIIIIDSTSKCHEAECDHFLEDLRATSRLDVCDGCRELCLVGRRLLGVLTMTACRLLLLLRELCEPRAKVSGLRAGLFFVFLKLKLENSPGFARPLLALLATFCCRLYSRMALASRISRMPSRRRRSFPLNVARHLTSHPWKDEGVGLLLRRPSEW
jgi:hypothetical protein